MQIIVHKDVLSDLLAGKKAAHDALDQAILHKMDLYSSKSIFDRLNTHQKKYPDFPDEIWNENMKKVEENIKFIALDSQSPLYKEWKEKISDTDWNFTFAVAQFTNIYLIWTNIAPLLSKRFNIPFISTIDMQNPQKISLVLVGATEVVTPGTAIGPINYLNYGEKSDFHWLEANRLDPMFYERFLHFFGLKCLNDDKIYYLNPVESGALSLPDPANLGQIKDVWKIRIEESDFDEDNEENYSFSVYQADITNWRYYWQLFLQKNALNIFSEGGEVINKDEDLQEKRIKINIVKEVSELKSDVEDFSLIKYEAGSDIFTTDLSFSEFSLPPNVREMTIQEAITYFGIDLKRLKKAGRGLKIGQKVFGIGLLFDLSWDINSEEITAEDREDWEQDYDLFFEEN